MDKEQVAHELGKLFAEALAGLPVESAERAMGAVKPLLRLIAVRDQLDILRAQASTLGHGDLVAITERVVELVNGWLDDTMQELARGGAA
jgi:hypothetical protein